MSHEIHRVTAFRQVDTYCLAVSFEDGSQQEIDFEPVLAYRSSVCGRREQVTKEDA